MGLLELVLLGLCTADLVVRRGAQAWAWVTKEEKTVATDVSTEVSKVETTVKDHL